MPAMLSPGIIGASTEKAITSAPTSMSFEQTAAVGAQNTRGANSSQSPAKQLAHWPNHAVLLDRDNMPKSAIRRPLATSLQASAIARHSIEARPRSAVTVATRLATESASAIPKMSGLDASQGPDRQSTR